MKMAVIVILVATAPMIVALGQKGVPIAAMVSAIVTRW
jgi:hypothetical protein